MTKRPRRPHPTPLASQSADFETSLQKDLQALEQARSTDGQVNDDGSSVIEDLRVPNDMVSNEDLGLTVRLPFIPVGGHVVVSHAPQYELDGVGNPVLDEDSNPVVAVIHGIEQSVLVTEEYPDTQTMLQHMLSDSGSAVVMLDPIETVIVQIDVEGHPQEARFAGIEGLTEAIQYLKACRQASLEALEALEAQESGDAVSLS